VISFEPNKESYNYFVENITLNNVENITLYNKGVYNKSTFCKVVQHGVNTNTGCFYIKECNKNDDESIEVIKLDDLDINDNVDFIKINTEGSELQVLEGASNLINKYKPLIQVETNHCSYKYFGYRKDKIYDFMKHHDYKILNDDGTNPLFFCK
jgi:FkbM family methyltransferase